MLDFTLDMYENLCQTALKFGFHVCTVQEFLTKNQDFTKCIIFRHDVDRRPAQALAMAELEASYGIKSTYYFRTKKSVFKKDIILKIKNLGHEIGYHYETLATCKGNIEKAITLFDIELKDFRRLSTINTISMHGRPLSPYDNRDIWKKHNFEDFNIIGECYLSIDYSKVNYFSDTGRNWHSTRYNIRDKVQNIPSSNIETTCELIKYIREIPEGHICLLTHPNRWTHSPVLWGYELIFDFLANRTKQFIKIIRR